MSYATVQELRSFGIEASEVSNDLAAILLPLASRIIDEDRGQWFEVRNKELELEVSAPTHILSLPMLLTTVDWFKVDEVEISSDLYTLWKSTPEDWENPKIVFLDIYSEFIQGKPLLPNQRILIKGNWGCVLKTGTTGTPPVDVYATPPEIKYATCALVLNLKEFVTKGGNPALQEVVRSETTDKHSITYSDKMLSELRTSIIPKEIQLLLIPFRRPLALA